MLLLHRLLITLLSTFFIESRLFCLLSFTLACKLISLGPLAASICCAVFFFFQAEDGIRDDLVTGVQTCALPILRVVTADDPIETRLQAPGGVFILPELVDRLLAPFTQVGSPVIALQDELFAY